MKLWKRLSILLLAATLILAAVPPQSVAAETLDPDGPLYAGFSKVRIDPVDHPDGPITALPMVGYGTSTDRLSDGGMDDTGDGIVDGKDGLFATCIAISDRYGKTILYYGIDILNPNSTWISPAKKVILAALEEAGHTVESGDLYLSASHTHNGPDLTYAVDYTPEQLAEDPIAQRAELYRSWVFDQLSAAALEALADREEVTLTKGEFDVSDAILAMNPNATANQQRMNYVRHYITEVNGEIKYGGSNFGYTKYTADTTMAMEPVDRMHLIQFTPKSGEKDPIVLVNWDAHVTMNSTTSTKYGRDNHVKISSDWVNNLRYGVEAGGYRVAFSQATGGNKTPQTPVKALQNPDIQVDGEGRGYKYGARLAEIALYGLQNHMGKPLDTSRIRNATGKYKFNTYAPTAEEAELVLAMLEADPSTYPAGYESLVEYLIHADTWPKRTQYYSTYPYLKNINSRYQLSSINRRLKYFTTQSGVLSVGVLAIGKELSFVVAGNELADRYSSTDTLAAIFDNDWDDLIDETYGRPIVMGYTNGGNGYIPHQLAYIYNEGSTEYAIGSYESQTASYARYTGEGLIAFYDELLDTVNPSQTLYQCACGGKAQGKIGHTCEPTEYLPWTKDDSLPTSGYYFLTKDVVIHSQFNLYGTLHLDLRGHNITRVVTAEEGEAAENGQTHHTRVLSVAADAQLYLTDSTDRPGTISRDLSQLTEAQKGKITNYGLILLVNGTGSATLFDGILDATGMVAGGGACVCVYNEPSVFTMYGGLLKGGVSQYGGVMFHRGQAYLYGGQLTGGTTPAASGTAGIAVSKDPDGTNRGHVTLGGDVRIWDNTRPDGLTININLYTDPDKTLTVNGDFTGKVGIYLTGMKEGKVVGTAQNAKLLAGSLVPDTASAYRVTVSGDQLILTAKPAGDVDGSKSLNTEDAVYLLLHVLFGEKEYPTTAGVSCDIDGNGAVNTEDAVYLLLHVLFGAADYPLWA